MLWVCIKPGCDLSLFSVDPLYLQMLKLNTLVCPINKPSHECTHCMLILIHAVFIQPQNGSCSRCIYLHGKSKQTNINWTSKYRQSYIWTEVEIQGQLNVQGIRIYCISGEIVMQVSLVENVSMSRNELLTTIAGGVFQNNVTFHNNHL